MSFDWNGFIVGLAGGTFFFYMISSWNIFASSFIMGLLLAWLLATGKLEKSNNKGVKK